MPPGNYKLVTLANGTSSLHSTDYRETFHPVIGPVAEAEALYVRQLKLPERIQQHQGEFVIWDVGLGAAANVVTVLRATAHLDCSLRIISFDNTAEPLSFALKNVEKLDYLQGFESQAATLLGERSSRFQNDNQKVSWSLFLHDFPTFIQSPEAKNLPAPHAIMFDAFSPAKNPHMWTAPLFAQVYELLDPKRPCALPTYSRSTMLRVTLLLAGFYVGVGHATGEKEETTIASNDLDLLQEPLDAEWLKRAHRSTSAEPMWEPVYRQAPLALATWEKLRTHKQFTS
jgi:tRNA U34 5-methylaminomethyl-2-thiouridine-forming methyltransferase MnmC